MRCLFAEPVQSMCFHGVKLLMWWYCSWRLWIWRICEMILDLLSRVLLVLDGGLLIFLKVLDLYPWTLRTRIWGVMNTILKRSMTGYRTKELHKSYGPQERFLIQFQMVSTLLFQWALVFISKSRCILCLFSVSSICYVYFPISLYDKLLVWTINWSNII